MVRSPTHNRYYPHYYCVECWGGARVFSWGRVAGGKGGGFIDYSKAFDCVCHQDLMDITATFKSGGVLVQIGISSIILNRFLQMWYQNTRNYVI